MFIFLFLCFLCLWLAALPSVRNYRFSTMYPVCSYLSCAFSGPYQFFLMTSQVLQQSVFDVLEWSNARHQNKSQEKFGLNETLHSLKFGIHNNIHVDRFFLSSTFNNNPKVNDVCTELNRRRVLISDLVLQD